MFDISIKKSLVKSDFIWINECFQPAFKQYGKGEIITICSPENDIIGIITDGVACLVTTNSSDQRRILDYYEAGDFFGEHFLPNAENKLFYVVAKTKCAVSFIKYQKLLSPCEKNCQKHKELIDRIIMVTAQKALIHIEILGQRTLRGKLMTFFEYISRGEINKKFTVPLPYSDLADYLAVDRSAMMRELKSLAKSGIISVDKRNITIL